MQAAPLRCVFVFSAAEPLEEELTADGWLPQIEDWPNVTVTRLAVRDHTLRPLMAQQEAHAALDRAVEAELGARRAAALSWPASALALPAAPRRCRVASAGGSR